MSVTAYIPYVSSKFFDITGSKIYICYMMLSSKNIGILKHFFAERPVKKAYLFGSYSRNDALQIVM